MPKTVIKEILETPLCGEYDVIVCGGGISGLAAAVSASRMGASVLLIEKNIILGGLATVGLISWYEPICDGQGNQIMYGMAEEMLSLSIEYGFNSLPEEWKQKSTEKTQKRYATYFSPYLFAMALDGWFLESGAKLLLDTVVVSVVMEENFCKGVIVENKTGRGFYSGKVIIDATGDADVLYRAGVPCVCGKNYLTYIAYQTDLGKCAAATSSKNIRKSRVWASVGADLWGNGHPADFPELTGVTAEEITDFVITGRKMLFDKTKAEPGSERDITTLPAMAQFRTSRRISGAYELVKEDRGIYFTDSIGVACDFTKAGHLYELPYRILYHEKYDNLLTAGRSVSASGWAWHITRVIPVAAATGQAAGIAAALSAKYNKKVYDLDVDAIQNHLLESNVRIHI
ncbi:MAG: FAD-dependent oxidoreductase [Thermoanaerobacteraceae bacterium]|nr:FAD-dependent oxidoreductase [Thermoanaerobacteraceae bacterium]